MQLKYKRYMYDLSDRIARIEDSNGNTTAFGYDDNSNGSNLSENISGTSYVTGYVYDKDNRLKEADIYDGSKVTYSYDTLGRLSTAAITSGTYNQQTTYNYNNEKLQSIVLPGGRTISYTYDNNGNILTINDTGNNKEIEYKYNELDELIRENNQVTGKTVIYAYDDGGNVKSKTEYAYTTDADPQNPTATHTYNYDTTWKDKLASYDGQAITYDAAGNPKNYNGLSFAWQNGNQLKSITGNGLDISYKYNYDGTRTEKTVNGTTTKYHLVNGNVTYETDGTDTIYYTYDNSGNILSMNLNNTEYYYLKNAQGDIIGLTDNTGTQVVSYTYDSWGKLISIDGTLKDTVGVKNPYRYRGYRYDTETGLYYLQSRYYNPEWGRFINTDSELGNTGELLGHNIFAYCKNNSVNLEDPMGTTWLSSLKKFYFNTCIWTYCTLNMAQNIMINRISSIFRASASKTIEVAGELSFKTGKAGEKYLAKLVGGESQVYFKTSLGGRYIDQLSDGIAYESKVGYTSLTDFVKKQILKDAELIKTGQINGADWNFFRSAITGKIGASKQLLAFLRHYGIKFVIHK